MRIRKLFSAAYSRESCSGSRVEQDAIERANRFGHLFVSSAGNNDMATDTSEYVDMLRSCTAICFQIRSYAVWLRRTECSFGWRIHRKWEKNLVF